MPKPSKFIAIYARVSSNQQSTRSQMPDLKRWAAQQELPVRWFIEKASGKTLSRPEWQKIEVAMQRGQVAKVACWRLDRIGRTAKGLTALLSELQQRKVDLVSLREGLELSTPAGRLTCHIMASVAQYETEVRGERVAAGQAVARAAYIRKHGEAPRWGGSVAGVRKKVKPAQIKAIKRLKDEGEPITAIAQAVGLSRPTIYSVLAG